MPEKKSAQLDKVKEAIVRKQEAIQEIQTQQPDRPRTIREIQAEKAKEAEVDPLADAPVEFTQEQVKEALQVYMKKSGIEKTKELMIKYGADKAKPTLPTIPVAKYAEIMAALEKEK